MTDDQKPVWRQFTLFNNPDVKGGLDLLVGRGSLGISSIKPGEKIHVVEKAALTAAEAERDAWKITAKYTPEGIAQMQRRVIELQIHVDDMVGDLNEATAAINLLATQRDAALTRVLDLEGDCQMQRQALEACHGKDGAKAFTALREQAEKLAAALSFTKARWHILNGDKIGAKISSVAEIKDYAEPCLREISLALADFEAYKAGL